MVYLIIRPKFKSPIPTITMDFFQVRISSLCVEGKAPPTTELIDCIVLRQCLQAHRHIHWSILINWSLGRWKPCSPPRIIVLCTFRDLTLVCRLGSGRYIWLAFTFQCHGKLNSKHMCTPHIWLPVSVWHHCLTQVLYEI